MHSKKYQYKKWFTFIEHFKQIDLNLCDTTTYVSIEKSKSLNELKMYELE